MGVVLPTVVVYSSSIPEVRFRNLGMILDYHMLVRVAGI